MDLINAFNRQKVVFENIHFTIHELSNCFKAYLTDEVGGMNESNLTPTKFLALMLGNYRYVATTQTSGFTSEDVINIINIANKLRGYLDLGKLKDSTILINESIYFSFMDDEIIEEILQALKNQAPSE